MASAREERNREAAGALEPLAEDERPRAVTVGAVISAAGRPALAVSTAIAIIADVEVNGDEPSVAPGRSSRR